MLFFISPTGNLKPPTREEFSVMFWLFVILLFGFGVVLLYNSFGQPPEKHAEAIAARWSGSALTLICIGTLLLNWARKRYTPW